MEILVIYVPHETLDHIQFYAWKLPPHYCCIYEFLKLCHEQAGWEYWCTVYTSTLYSGAHIQSLWEQRKEINIITSMNLIEDRYSNWKSSSIIISNLPSLSVLKFEIKKQDRKAFCSQNTDQRAYRLNLIHFILLLKPIFRHDFICSVMTMVKAQSWIISGHHLSSRQSQVVDSLSFLHVQPGPERGGVTCPRSHS